MMTTSVEPITSLRESQVDFLSSPHASPTNCTGAVRRRSVGRAQEVDLALAQGSDRLYAGRHHPRGADGLLRRRGGLRAGDIPGSFPREMTKTMTECTENKPAAPATPQPRGWYVVHTQSGYEDRVKKT